MCKIMEIRIKQVLMAIFLKEDGRCFLSMNDGGNELGGKSWNL